MTHRAKSRVRHPAITASAAPPVGRSSRVIPPVAPTLAPDVPLRLQVYRQLRSAIEHGNLPPGARLPPTREQASLLGVSRNTVLWAMERLRAEGYVVAHVGRGSFVAEGFGPPVAWRRAVRAMAPVLSRRGQAIADIALRWLPPTQAAKPFRIGAPEVQTFPYAVWDRLSRQVSASERQSLAQYLDPAGWPPLREAIAQWLWASRGLRCDAAQVLVCSGSQQALDLIGRLLLDPGDEVMVEDPGYPGIRAALMGQGAQTRPVPLDDEGLDIDQGAERWPRARLVVATPGCQFPTGVRMSLARRLALMIWAHRHDGWVVEDDYDGEFQYGAHRLPAMASLLQADRVLYVGTFSKALHPGLRLGFIVLPVSLVPAFAMARAVVDRHAPGDTQAVLARFIAEGHLLRHLNRMRDLYPARQARLRRLLAELSDGALQLHAQHHGLHLLHEVRAGSADHQVSARAMEAGVMLPPLSRYAIETQRRGRLFGYAGYDDTSLRRAAEAVAPLLRRMGGRR
ncbi:PLP-dependent aminotransferase family protein [Ideonella sp. DXS29W]|uniref:PLP-dependent aminotransferase family protein n=1 Tax=Ideonella lacteola TaxID=2984193 RepID=A0ABU9BUV1_9BURK